MTSSDGCTDTYSQTLTLYARPNADFTVPADACGPVTLAPSAGTDYGSNGTINAWSWSVTDGGTFSQTSTQQNPSFALPASTNGAVTYTVQQIVTDDRGCKDTVLQTFSVFPTPTASFTLPTDVCTNTNINTVLTDSSTPNDGTTTLNYSWTITDPSGTAVHTSNLTVPNYVLLNTTNAAITYTVNLTVTNTDGCTATLSTTIIVYPDAIAQINTTAIAGCAPLTVTASDLFATSYTTNDTYTWTITDAAGNPVTTTPATLTGATGFNHTVTAVNTTLTVTLTVSSAHGCNSATATATITTYDDPDPSWTLTSNAGCNPFTPTVATVAATNPALTHSWDVFDATGTQVGTTLTGLNPTLPTLSNTSNTTDATYTITHTVSDQSGCSDSQDLTVTVYPTPSADFTMTTAGCAAWTPVISDASVGKTGLQYSWSITPNGTFTSQATLTGETTSTPALTFSALQYPQADQNYTLTLTVTSSDGCTDTYSQTLTLYARPNADFTVPADACGPVTLAPSAGTDYGSNGTINAWSWSVTDGGTFSQTSTQQNPSFALPASTNGAVTYTVQQIVTDDRGCKDTVLQTFSVFPTPTASFTLPTDVCTNTNINTVLTDSSTPNDGTTTLNYSWTITDPSGTAVHTSNLTVPNYVLLNTTNAAITYTVNLTVTNTDGCTATLSTTIIVYPDAIAQINTTAIAGCAPLTVTASDLFATSYTTNDTYTWTITDAAGNPVTTTPATLTGATGFNHTVTAVNTTLTVTLTVSSAHGCNSATATATITTYDDPDPSWTLTSNAGCNPFTPTVATVAATNPALTHSWDVFDATGTQVGTTLTGLNPTLPTLSNTSNTTDATYTITHTVSDQSGCSDSQDLTVTVYPTPSADFTMTTAGCAAWTPVISDASVGKTGLQYSWSITPNGTFTSQATLTGETTSTPALTFSALQYPQADQNYTLTLTVTSSDGCTDTYSQTLTLYARPNADFTVPADACGPVTLAPSAGTDYGSNGTINAWSWSVTDGGTFSQTSTQQNPSFALPASTNGAVTYTVQQIVTDDRGCKDTVLQTFSVFPTPTASFTLPTDVCTNTNINTVLTDSSTPNDGTTTLNYSWTITDPSGTAVHTSNLTVPNYVLLNTTNAAITYTVNLTVTNTDGCTATLSTTIIVYPDAIAQINTTAIAGCAPLTVTASDLFATSYTTNDTYTWTITDAAGNPVTTTPATLTGATGFNHTVTAVNTTLTVTLTVSSAHGCNSATATATITTYDDPDPSWTLTSNAGCNPFTPTVATVAATNPALTHSWDVFDATGTQVGTTLTGLNPTLPTLSNTSNTTDATYTITHTVSDQSGCSDSQDLTVTVYPTPSADFTMTTAGCAAWTPVISDASVGKTGLQYSWSITPNGTFTSQATLTGETTSTPALTFSALQYPQADQNYTLTLTVTSSDGCTDTYSQTLTLYARPNADFTVPADACGPVTLAPSAGTDYGSNGTINAWSWSVTDGGTFSQTSTQQNPSFALPASTNGAVTYTVQQIVTDDRGCKDTVLQTFSVFPTPTASFTLPTDVCTNTNINTVLTDSSTPNDGTTTLNYSWTITDPSGTAVHTSNLTVPNYVLLNTTNAAITYTVNLTVTNTDGCTATLSTTIIVYPDAIAQINTTAIAGCAPLTVTASDLFATSYTTNDTYTWTITDAAGNPVTTTPATLTGATGFNHTVTAVNTTLTVTLTVSSAHGCNSATATATITTYDDPDPSWTLTSNAGCNPFTPTVATVAATNPALTHSWDVFDATGTQVGTTLTGLNPTLPTLSNTSNTTDATYTITHTVSDQSGCSDSQDLTVTVYPTPSADFTMTTAGCAAWTPVISDASVGKTGLQYSWSITPNGTFTSQATLTGETTSTPALTFSALQYPQADQNYTLTLTVTSSDGCTDTYSQTLTLYARPNADFTVPADACGPVTLAPSAGTDYGSNGTINAWSWSVTDGGTFSQTSTQQNPSFALPASTNGAVTYTVQQIVTDDRGCKDTVLQTFSVFPTPTASFTLPTDVCTNTNINTVLTDSSTPNDGTTTLNYSWTITDPSGTAVHTSNLTVPNYVLLNTTNAAITYTVNLTVTNTDGCTATLSTTIIVYPDAIAQINTTAIAGCAPLTVTASDLFATSYTTNDTYTWTITDAAGNPVTTTPATLTGATGFNHTVTAVNTTLTVTLTVSSAHGCNSATATATITTYDDPDPSWTLTSNAGCNPFTPTVATVAATNPALTHSWDVFDATGTQVGTTLTGLNPTLPTLSNTSNTTDATYTITHTVSDQSGCSDSQDLTVTVYPTPSADFTMTTAGCAAWTPVISDASVGKTGLQYSWSITPNGTFTSQATLTGETTSTPALTFSALQYPQADQNYTLTLTVTSSDGCTDTYSQTLTLYARPNADFTVPADACGPVTLAPSAGTDYGSNGTINAWSWSVTDGGTFSQTSTQQNPSFALPASTNGAVTYTVQQIVTDDRGCKDTVLQTFSVFPTPTASFTLPTDVCTNTNINTVLTDSSTPNDGTTTLNYSWTITDPSGTAVHTSNLTVPNYVLLNTTNAAITYTVNLTVTNTDGCTATLSTTIIVYPDAVVDLVTSTLYDCAPFTIDSTVVSAVHYAVNNSYLWSVKNTAGTVLSTFNGRNNLNHNISASEDSVWVVLQVTSLHGCLDNKDSVLVYTLPNPNPYFDLAADTGCTAFNPIIDSIGQSTGLHVWEVFDSSNNQIGTTLVGNAPVLPTLLNNNTSGLSTYTITHTVFATDSSSCDSSYTQNVYVHPLSIPTINSIGVFCGFDTIPLSATSTNNANVSQWTWTIGSDTLLGQNINYYNPTPGTYGISLTTTTLAGCDTTIYDSLTIHSYPVADISISDCGVDTVCLNQSFNFFDASSTSAFGGNIISFAWDFDDNGSIDYTTQNGSHSYSSTGLKSLRLTVTTQYGCIDDTLINIYVNAPPVNSFEIIDSALCGPTTFNISESDTGIVDSSYYELFTFNGSTKILIQSWNSLPNPLPTLQPNYIADTVYYLSREIFNCCGSDYIEDSIIIRTPPVADFVILPDTGCTPLNTIIQIDGLIKGQADSAYFDFGDGSNTSILPTKIQQGSSFVYQWGQLNHVFTYGGTLDTTYYVTLTVFNDCGDSSLTLPVYVEPNTVQAAFGMDKSSGCSPLTVNFTNYSYNTTNTAWCFDWDVATNTCNGGGSVNQNPTWTFTQPGTYTVALLVDNGCGYDTAFQNVTVFPSPIAVISSNNNVCANDSVNFISNSTTSAGFIAGHLWEFGNGDTSILQNVDYLYDTSGVYTVTLTVTSSTGCSDSTSAIINIRPTPEVNFTTQNVCLNDTTFFENLTTLSNGQIIGNAWNFGDGNSSNAFEPYHIYNAPGTYQVTLTHTSDYGCIDSSQQIAIVHDLPQLSFTPSLINGDSCSVPQTYLFTNNSTNSIQYTWDFDYSNNPGINTSTLTSPSFTFTAPGVYRIALFGETAFGCIDSLFTSILVRDGVNARHSINPIDGCEPLDVVFQDTSIYTNTLDTIASVQWFFGDGSNFIQATAPFNYVHTYNTYGTYNAYSVVTMTSGCKDTSATTIINIYPTPSADFTINRVNINTRRFQNLTTYVDSNVTYSWTFSDGQSSSDESPTMTFEPSNTGLDSIRACLKVINSFGCEDSICKSFWVWPTNLVVPNAFAPGINYVGEDAVFLPKGHSLDQYEIWIYDKWGNEVFYSSKIDPSIKSPGEPWDGTDKNGEPLAMGVYAWKIRAVFDDGTRWTGQSNVYGIIKTFGTLTLLR